MLSGSPASDIFYGLMAIVIALIGAWCRQQETKIGDLEKFRDSVHTHWEADARNYTSKAEFVDFVKEIKASLLRIEAKIEKIRE